MKVKEINTLSELKSMLAANQRTFLLLYKGGSATSGCAESYLEEAVSALKEGNVLKADANKVRDIHPDYGVDTVPSLLVFEKNELKNIIKGCQTASYYKNLIENQLYQSNVSSSGKSAPSVTVYSTPTCPWCTTLKNYLRQHKIQFTDINVAADPHMAQELVRKSGHTGVPQTEINGQMIVGFDKARLNSMLNING
ncbi:MAG: glutaredoxin domain-containing protein [Lentimicrobiaceae bacterium]|jgi:glutaredoxin-like YruB-family protein|nr:glutaredoxin domain-containing protein [Lentimicrobiaceae bacterium]MDD4597441.1 glutaredoxin domain-containing protein [Lentimicrobiaceae bacterium]MDY0026457.1 glutaredoxin domain-containing protein [Lentimicrobium sp.]